MVTMVTMVIVIIIIIITEALILCREIFTFPLKTVKTIKISPVKSSMFTVPFFSGSQCSQSYLQCNTWMVTLEHWEGMF